MIPTVIDTNPLSPPGSPTDSDQDDRVAVAYHDQQVQQPHTDRSTAANIPVSQPKFKVLNTELS